MAIPVKLQVFEGPLDLLLHLIDKNKIDIYDIPITEITEQYLAYIRQLQAEDMNIMSEFLLMAATLLDIKCRMLLPAQVNEEGEEEDPRQELVEKLLEYKMYRYMSYELKDRQLDADRIYYKKPTIPEEVASYQSPVDMETLLADVNLKQLQEIFVASIKRSVDKIDPIRSNFGKIEKDEINIEEKLDFIQNYVRTHNSFSFRKLLEKKRNKMEVVVTFLTILEMIKMGQITIRQDELFDDIIIISNME